MIIDIDAIPPEGVSVIVTNTTMAGSNSPVDVEEGGEGSDAVSITMGTTPEESEEELDGNTAMIMAMTRTIMMELNLMETMGISYAYLIT